MAKHPFRPRLEMQHEPENPDHYGHYPPFDADEKHEYFKGILSITSFGIVNFYHPVDRALSPAIWEFNQTLKPLNPYYSYIFGEYRRLIIPTEPLVFPDNCYEIFSFAAEAWSKALGAQAGIRNNVINSDIDLKVQFEFTNARSDHSAEFQANIMKRWDYWKKLLSTFKISTSRR